MRCRSLLLLRVFWSSFWVFRWVRALLQVFHFFADTKMKRSCFRTFHLWFDSEFLCKNAPSLQCLVFPALPITLICHFWFEILKQILLSQKSFSVDKDAPTRYKFKILTNAFHLSTSNPTHQHALTNSLSPRTPISCWNLCSIKVTPISVSSTLHPPKKQKSAYFK